MKRLPLLVLGVFALPCFVLADVITLKDGSKVEGEIRRSGDVYLVKDAGGKTTSVPAETVSGIEVRPQAGNDTSMSRLLSLRRAAENLSDIKPILDRYRSFLDQNPNTPAAVAAAKDIQIWQDRLDKGMVKVGDKWMTAAERDALRGLSGDIAVQIHDMLKQGRLKQATQFLDKSLAIDPKNISLLYLRGVVQYDEEQLGPARKSFETVVATAQDHAPTLNNLAIILWRQKALIVALGYYDRALLAAPGRPEILDNVAEALNALPKEQRDTAVTKKLIRHFKEQDDALQKKMAENGMRRWGSSWVSDKEYQKLIDQEKALAAQMNQMQVDFDAVQKRVGIIDQLLVSISNQMALLDASTYATSPSGQVVRLPYPPAYFQLGRQAEGLKAERADRVADLDHLRKGAKQVQQQTPVKFSGLQKLIDADGMPIPAGQPVPAAAPVAPVTRPAAPPLNKVPL